MAQYNRFDGNVVPFASNATGFNRTVFGDTTQSDNIDDNLNADYKTGWEIVGVNDAPTKQDFNALGYTLSNLISYLYQVGIAEWNTSQEYFINSICIASDGNIYKSNTDNNIGNDPTTDDINWGNAFDSSNFVDKTSDEDIDGIKNFLKSPTAPTPTLGDNSTKVATTAFVQANAGIDIATAAEIRTGTDNTKAITPLGYNQTTFGWGQTWQNVAASRSAGVTYTNSTGKPIEVAITINTDVNKYIYVDGNIIGQLNDGSLRLFFTFIVPNGSTYAMESGATIERWLELR